MTHLQKLGLLCILLAITSCASTKPPLPEVQIPPERMSQNGYSFVPLNEKGWKIVERNAYQIGLAKFGESPDETYAIQAIPFRLPTYKTIDEFVILVKEGQAKDTDLERFKLVTHEVTSYPMKGTDCVKSHMVTEDRDATKRSGKSGDMVLEALSITCALPSEKNVGVSIIYSQRNYPGQEDPGFIEKATSILSSVQFAEARHIDTISPAAKFSTLCADILAQTSNKNKEFPTNQSAERQVTQTDSINKLASIGISIWQYGGAKGKGSYALFEKQKDGGYALITVQPYYIEIKDKDNQEVLFVSNGLDSIAPAFNMFRLNNDHVFVCGTGFQNVTGIDSSTRTVYNPCDSSLTSASNVGTSILANTALTISTLGLNVITGSTATFVDTDKEKIAEMVVDSKLYKCLTEANQNGLKAEFKAMLAKEFSDANNPGSKEQVDVDCSEGEEKFSAEAYFRRGKERMTQSKYKSAMACFMRAQEDEKDTQVYRDSCSQIATMYELGWGVEKDIETAKVWLKKAGL